MSFTDTFESGVKHTPENPSKSLWFKTMGFAAFIFFVIALSMSTQRHVSGAELINVSTAWTAVVLIGLSMLLSAICYFWNAFDHYILFRKHLGVSGFVIATIHVVFSLIILRSDFPFPNYYLHEKNIISFLFGLTAFAYFAFMTSISNNYAVREIGGQKWRKLLRYGYIAYIFTIIHFGLRGLPYWIKWIQGGMKTMPSLGFVLFIFALFVPYFRIVLEIALRQQRKLSNTHETL